MTTAPAAALPPRGVDNLVREAAARFADRVALAGAGMSATWGELDRAATAGAAWLSGRPSGPVLVVLPTGPELAAALFACARAGRPAAPLAVGHPDVAAVADRLGARTVIGGPGPDALTPAEVSGWFAVPAAGDGVGSPGSDDVVGSPGNGDHVRSPRSGEDIALLARAGSSAPVLLSHRAVLAAVTAIGAATHLRLRADDRVLQVLPMSHPAGWVTAFLPLAAVGATAVVPPEPARPGEWIEQVLAAIRQHRVTVIPGAPSLYRRLRTVEGAERALASVRLLTSGAAPLAGDDAAAVRSVIGLPIWEGYGIAESASVVASSLMTAAPRRGSVGLPLPGIELRIVADDDDEDDPGAADEFAPGDTGPAETGPGSSGTDAYGTVAAAADAAVNPEADTAPDTAAGVAGDAAGAGTGELGGDVTEGGTTGGDRAADRSGAAPPPMASDAPDPDPVPVGNGRDAGPPTPAAAAPPGHEDENADTAASAGPPDPDGPAPEPEPGAEATATDRPAPTDPAPAVGTGPERRPVPTAAAATRDDMVAEVPGDGGVGRIAVRGATLFSGYWPDGADGPDADGWFVTTDVGYLDDAGELHLVDRAEGAVVVAGFTVYPREVEEVLSAHPYVRDAAVIGVPGRVGQAILAVLVAQRGTRPTAADLDEFLAARLPVFKRPVHYRLVERLPRTEVGRVDRDRVRREYLDDPDESPAAPVHLTVSGTGPAGSDGPGRRGLRRPRRRDRRAAADTDEDLF